MLPCLGSATRFDASDVKVTNRPSALSDASPLSPSAPVPFRPVVMRKNAIDGAAAVDACEMNRSAVGDRAGASAADMTRAAPEPRPRPAPWPPNQAIDAPAQPATN